MGHCQAMSKRSRQLCKNWAMRGKSTCRFHGGKSTGPKTAVGKKRIQQAHYKHGGRSKEHREKMREIRDLIRKSKNFLHNCGEISD